MSGDEYYAIADQFVGERHGLIGVAGVVADDQLDALAKYTALGVEISDRELGAALILLAEPGIGPGHVAGDCDPDLGPRGRSPERRSQHDHGYGG